MWGVQKHPDGTGNQYAEPAFLAKLACDVAAKNGSLTWRMILAEEVLEVFAEPDPVKLQAELVQVAAVCKQWSEAIDRRKK